MTSPADFDLVYIFIETLACYQADLKVVIINVLIVRFQSIFSILLCQNIVGTQRFAGSGRRRCCSLERLTGAPRGPILSLPKQKIVYSNRKKKSTNFVELLEYDVITSVVLRGTESVEYFPHRWRYVRRVFGPMGNSTLAGIVCAILIKFVYLNLLRLREVSTLLFKGQSDTGVAKIDSLLWLCLLGQ